MASVLVYTKKHTPTMTNPRNTNPETSENDQRPKQT